MRRIASSSEAEMIAMWLREELLASERFSSEISAILERKGISANIVAEPDLADIEANALRRGVLAEYRAYGGGDNLLSGFPVLGVVWERVALSPEELLSVMYIDWDYWLKLSDGSRRPLGWSSKDTHRPNGL